MKSIIESIFKNASFDKGEAALEFLLAIILNKLRLDSEHMSSLENLIGQEAVLNQFQKCFNNISEI